MTAPHKPTAGFWITVALVVVLVVYPLSFGPACWLVNHEILPLRPTAIFYQPLLESSYGGPVWWGSAVTTIDLDMLITIGEMQLALGPNPPKSVASARISP